MFILALFFLFRHRLMIAIITTRYHFLPATPLQKRCSQIPTSYMHNIVTQPSGAVYFIFPQPFAPPPCSSNHRLILTLQLNHFNPPFHFLLSIVYKDPPFRPLSCPS